MGVWIIPYPLLQHLVRPFHQRYGASLIICDHMEQTDHNLRIVTYYLLATKHNQVIYYLLVTNDKLWQRKKKVLYINIWCTCYSIQIYSTCNEYQRSNVSSTCYKYQMIYCYKWVSSLLTTKEKCLRELFRISAVSCG